MSVSESCFIVHPDLSLISSAHAAGKGDDLSEIIKLAAAIELSIAGSVCVKPKSIQAGAFLGKGQREMIGEQIESLAPDVVIFDGQLSPVQQRNLEKEWGAKVIDRTALILEIFGRRAQTKEGVLQVELALLEYQKSRLVRSWTHLERQRGGAGFMGGPGERQIELDRRILAQRMVKLKEDIEDVRRTRDLARQSRARVPLPVVALVGYTNAGKSTLFNMLTKAGVLAKDMLFATLDPTMRKLSLPSGRDVILSDTVGFISNLPTQLVAAFRATLEQVGQADVIVHVMDGADPDLAAHRKEVIRILKDLGVDYEQDERVIELYNKVDLLDDEMREDLSRDIQFTAAPAVMSSALDGGGMDAFLAAVEAVFAKGEQEYDFALPAADGAALSWLYRHGQVLDNHPKNDVLHVRVRLSGLDFGRFKAQFSY